MIGTIAAVYTTFKIAGKDYKGLTGNSKLVRILPVLVAVLLGLGMIVLYYFMNGAE
jgi:hypothetical protein